MAILSNGKFYGFLCSVKATGRKLSNGVKEYVEDFVSGFAGHGWKLWEYIKGKWKLEIDSLVVRETMVVFELLIQKIRAVKGALGITQACGRIKTATLDESGQNWLVTIEDEMSFVAHDFIRCQDWTNGTLKGYWVEISEIRKIDGVDTIVIPVSEFTGGIGYTDGMEAVDPALSGMTTPAIGDEIVQFGNSVNVNRQSAIYLHADEGGQPAIDILFGINSKSFAGCTKIRMGGELPGTDGLKGFYCENGMIKGTDSTGHVVYCIYPDGTAEFGDGSAKFATDKSGYIAGGAISWHWDASKNKYVCSMKGVVLTWDNLDEETKENLKGEPGTPGEDGKDANLLPWVEQWNNNKTEIDGEYIVSPKMFSGTKDSNGKLTGVAIGRDCITVDGEKRTGIFALVDNEIVFELDPLTKKYIFKGTIEADGGKIAGFKIEGDALSSLNENGSILIEENGVHFLRINEYGMRNPAAALLSVRNDKGSAVSLSGGSGKDVLSILGNGASNAISSAGSHEFIQRKGEKWNAPGALWAGRITGAGGISNRWGDGCYMSVSRTDTGNYVFRHDLNHTDYFIIATGVNENWTICIISDKQSNTFTVKTFHKDQGWINSAFEVVVIGRNKTA